MKARITDVKKFAVHDGDGIRTTVFFKGCPLKCVWCHNPETISAKPKVGFFEHKCVLCGKCAAVCQNHKIIDGKHIFDRDNCIRCKKCVEACAPKALEWYGEDVSIDDIVKALLEDRDFYETSNGGITLSGGECLLQPEACREILKRMKLEGINTAVDTCAMVPWKNIEEVIDYTDTFLFDLKAIDEDVHKKCTGVSNKLILENLMKIDDYGKNIEIRIPYVPGYNDGEMEKIAKVVAGLKNLVRVRVLAYHNYAGSKYKALDMENTLPEKIPATEELEQARNIFIALGIECWE